ncbi:MAG: thymidine phosphorylase, partial [Calditrichota bacterium]
MSPYEIISCKRDGKALSETDIHGFIKGFMKDEVTDYQMTALLMAVYLRGMNKEETVHLTRAYIESGIHINLDHLPGIKVDKHSTGGVGDKVSIILAPLAASLDIYVPMMSGRGLGHSGGTLDKLESIPGFRTNLHLDEFHKVLQKHHLALIGQTAELVPADKRIYALRDVTATVDCIPLICASIMSKKIAEGSNGLVLDVKYGSGAFMKNVEDAEKLARNLIEIGSAFGQKVVASITSMEQPLGNKIGNWLEIEESIECLHG